MRSVGNCSVVSVWRNMGGEDLVQTAGKKTHSTLETVRVSSLEPVITPTWSSEHVQK